MARHRKFLHRGQSLQHWLPSPRNASLFIIRFRLRLNVRNRRWSRDAERSSHDALSIKDIKQDSAIKVNNYYNLHDSHVTSRDKFFHLK